MKSVLKLDLINSLFNNVKENKFLKNFINELSNNLENVDYKFNNLLSDDLTLYNNKIILKFKDEMLIERTNILQKYAEDTKEMGEILYIYNNASEENSYNLCSGDIAKSHEVITKKIEDLPTNITLGSVLRKHNDKFILDMDATKFVGKEINNMIKGKIEEQHEYLNSKRIDGHVYEVGEKYDGRIWLYDRNNITNGGIEGFEEIQFPKELYQNAKARELFIYQSGKYQKYI